MLVRVRRQVQEVPRSLIRDIVTVGAVGLLAVVAVGAYTTWRIISVGQQDEARPADAIVVMGAAQYDGRPSPVFRARLDHAVDLFLAGMAPRLVVTGGKAVGDRTTEAATARDYAIGRGVPAAAILEEDQARTTLQSIRGVRAVMIEAGLRTAVFVSDRQHMLRVLRMASDNGIEAWGSPTTTSPIADDGIARVDAIAHELGALALYFVTGDSSS